MKREVHFCTGGSRGAVRRWILPWLIAAGLILGAAGLVFAAFVQGFETDTAGWFGAIRVPSGTHVVPSKAGQFHAEDGSGAFTRWGGYSATYPLGG